HLISSLLCLETMILSIYIALSIWPIKKQTSANLMKILMLAFSACKASARLATLITSTPTHASDLLHNLNLLWC
ncbi:NU4LM oxidoreductase, partial [Amazona guildingii]|nr:NU4LM oxidoreductase [Amazona guildingii]